MIRHIRMIYKVLDITRGNVEEAERYAKKAHHYRHEDRAFADWCLDMSKKHLDFNNQSHSLLDQLCRELEEADEHDALHSAVMECIRENRAWIAEETAEVRMMDELYSR